MPASKPSVVGFTPKYVLSFGKNGSNIVSLSRSFSKVKNAQSIIPNLVFFTILK